MNTKELSKDNNIEKYNYHYLLGLKTPKDKEVEIEFFKSYNSKDILSICAECLLLNCTDENNEKSSSSSKPDDKKESDDLNNFRYDNMTLKIESVMNDLVPCLIHSNDKLSQEDMKSKILDNIKSMGQDTFIEKAKIEI